METVARTATIKQKRKQTMTNISIGLVGGTRIMVDSGNGKNPVGVPIEDVREGDYVFCFDNHLNLVLRKVLWAGKTGHKKVVRVHFWRDHVAGRYIDLTPEHKIRMADGVYVESCNVSTYKNCGILAADLLQPHNREEVFCDWVEELPDSVDVYDIHVDESPNFIANEICVHNSSDPNCD